MALDFDGSNDQVDHGDIAALDGAAALTVALWLNTDAHVNDETVLGRFKDASNDWMITQGVTADDIAFRIKGGANPRIGSTTTNLVTVGAWVHVAFVYDGSQAGDARVVGYVNAGLEALSYSGTGSFPATLHSGTDSFLVGGISTFANAKIALLKVWTAALSAAEIAREMHSYRPARATNLVLWCPYDDGTSGVDYSGNGNTGTVTGAVQAAGPPVTYGAPAMVIA